MTEKQGGSDVRANTTRAEPVGDGWFELHGHKWFCSYPPCDIFLVLAQAPAGLSCFVLERGAGMEFQRLKDKLGTRSLPSSEVEFRGAAARLLGEEGRGVATIIEMVTHTRLDCVIGSAAGDAPRRRRGDLARAPPQRVRRPADRAAGDGQRARRPGAGVRGRDRDRAAARARLRRGATPRCAASPPRSPSTGSASARRRTPSRRWSAWAATATSRSRRCRGCCATRR